MATHIVRDGDRHLSPLAYYSLALLAGAIGLAASYVTVRLFTLAILMSESDGAARELLTLAAALFVAAELAGFFIAGLVPVRRLRALRWQLIACAVLLVGFEAVSIYGARVTLVQSADARADAGAGRAAQLRASIDANRRSAAALVAAGQRSSQSAIASSRADGAQSIRQAAALEASTARMAAELAQVEAARAPTATAVFGQTGVIALAVAQSLLISCIGLLFLGAAGALARAARDVRGAASAAALPVPVPAPAFASGAPALPRGAVPAVPTGRRWAAAAGLGGAAMAAAPAFAAVPTMSAPAAPVLNRAHPGVLKQAHRPTDEHTEHTPRARRARARAGAQIDTGTDGRSAARYERVKTAVQAGSLKPSVRSIQAVEGGGTAVARRYLDQLADEGVIVSMGQGRGYKLA